MKQVKQEISNDDDFWPNVKEDISLKIILKIERSRVQSRMNCVEFSYKTVVI
jgi:hypothetical protein